MLVQTFVPPVLIVIAIVILSRGRGGSEMQVIDRMLKRIDDLENKTTMLLAWAMRLSQQVVELGGKPINYADIERTQNGLISSMSEDPSRLLQLLRGLLRYSVRPEHGHVGRSPEIELPRDAEAG